MNVGQFFLEHPVFRYEEFAAWKASLGTTLQRSIKSAIQYYLGKGRIKRIRRGLYAVIPENQTIESVVVDPYLVAAKASDDSVLAYHTALELHGYAYSVFETFTYLTSRKNTPFEYESGWYLPTTIPTSISNDNKKKTFGIVTMNRQGVDFKVTNIERTFVDILDRVELSGGWEEVYRATSSVVVLNVDEVIQYCLSLGNSRLTAKVGFFLEQRQGAFAVPEDKLKRLLKAKPKKPQYISSRKHGKFRLVKKWNLMMPVELLEQTWGETDVDI